MIAGAFGVLGVAGTRGVAEEETNNVAFVSGTRFPKHRTGLAAQVILMRLRKESNRCESCLCRRVVDVTLHSGVLWRLGDGRHVCHLDYFIAGEGL